MKVYVAHYSCWHTESDRRIFETKKESLQLTTECLFSQVEGLCGNFNGNQMDDFTTPMGGPPVTMANTFGDSWKVHDYCMDAVVSEGYVTIVVRRHSWDSRVLLMLWFHLQL